MAIGDGRHYYHKSRDHLSRYTSDLTGPLKFLSYVMSLMAIVIVTVLFLPRQFKDGRQSMTYLHHKSRDHFPPYTNGLTEDH